MTDVVILCWPAEQPEAERLNRLRIPHLLLVEPGADPPTSDDVLTDWIRLPSDERDLRARMTSLRRRAGRLEAPRLDGYGRLLFRDRWVALAPTEERLARPLVDQFAEPMRPDELVLRAYAEPPSSTSFRVQLSRLRRRIEPIGLTVRTLPNRSHILMLLEGGS